MKRIQLISKLPELGAAVAPEVKITVITQMLDAVIPLFTSKNPQNPVVEDPDSPEGESGV